MPRAHPGFQAVASHIAQESNPRTGRPYGIAVAKKILAARTRGFSAADKRANPRLKKVKGGTTALEEYDRRMNAIIANGNQEHQHRQKRIARMDEDTTEIMQNMARAERRERQRQKRAAHRQKERKAQRAIPKQGISLFSEDYY